MGLTKAAEQSNEFKPDDLELTSDNEDIRHLRRDDKFWPTLNLLLCSLSHLCLEQFELLGIAPIRKPAVDFFHGTRTSVVDPASNRD